jgi:hypothetical protein
VHGAAERVPAGADEGIVEALPLADAGARAAIVLGLQGRVGNSGLSRVLARQGDHAGGADGGQRERRG